MSYLFWRPVANRISLNKVLLAQSQVCVKLSFAGSASSDFLIECYPPPVFTPQFPQGSDQSWLQKLFRHLEVSPLFEKPRLSNEAFVIQHFADKVKINLNINILLVLLLYLPMIT